MKRAHILLLGAVLGIASCGRVAELKPPAGQALPVKPFAARTTPTAQDLLTRAPYARPDRADELVTRSQPRPSDPFDLPPATGGPTPPLSAGSEPQPVTNEAGVATPKS